VPANATTPRTWEDARGTIRREGRGAPQNRPTAELPTAGCGLIRRGAVPAPMPVSSPHERECAASPHSTAKLTFEKPCCSCRANTGDKLRSARARWDPRDDSPTAEQAAYHASPHFQPRFVSFIPLFDRPLLRHVLQTHALASDQGRPGFPDLPKEFGVMFQTIFEPVIF
jgi:hypothetical protein